MSALRSTLIALLVISFTSLHAHRNHAFNNGEDITRPLTRVDARIEYQKGDIPK